MEQNLDIYDYILTEESNYKTVRVPITGSKDWNMREHIERCTNVANAWFHTGKNDGLRPYKDIVTPIINVAFRSEGFDVKDIVPYVNEPDNYYKSFLIKKYHPQWARKNEIDTFLDDLVETSIIYDLALVKNVNNKRPEVVRLQSIAFCDQTDIMSGPICLKHQYTIPDLMKFKGKWNNDKIDEAILMARSEKVVSNAKDQTVSTPGKYIEIYELRGMMPDWWLASEDYEPESGKYSMQLHIVCYYMDREGKKQGLTLFKGKSPEMSKVFKALKIDRIKSHGRACGRSIVEVCFEDQVWTNFSEIKIKAMLEAAAINLLQTDSEDWADKRLDKLKNNSVIKHDPGRPINKVDTQPINMPQFVNYQITKESNARTLGSANEALLGENPNSGTPFKLQELVVQQGQGIHEYRQGKIATFVADELYRDWILGYLVDEMDGGKNFSEELTLEEMQEVAGKIATNKVEKKLKDMILDGKIVTPEVREQAMKFEIDKFMKGGNRKFFKTIAGELSKIPVTVKINIKQKQKDMARNADKLTNIIREIGRNPLVFQQVPGLGKTYNELLENSGMSPIDFTAIVNAPAKPVANAVA